MFLWVLLTLDNTDVNCAGPYMQIYLSSKYCITTWTHGWISADMNNVRCGGPTIQLRADFQLHSGSVPLIPSPCCSRVSCTTFIVSQIVSDSCCIFPVPVAAIRYFFRKPSFPLGGEWIFRKQFWTLEKYSIHCSCGAVPRPYQWTEIRIQHHGVHSGFLLSFPSCTCFFWWWETRLPFAYLSTWSLPLSVIVSFQLPPFPLWASLSYHLNSNSWGQSTSIC